MLYTINIKAEDLDEQGFNRIIDALKTIKLETALPEPALLKAGVSRAQSAELLFAFIQEIKNEFKDENWDYLDYIAERVLANG